MSATALRQRALQAEAANQRLARIVERVQALHESWGGAEHGEDLDPLDMWERLGDALSEADQ